MSARSWRSLVVRLSCVVTSVAWAQSTCDEALTRANLVACAHERSPALASEAAALRSAEGRREAARPFLPSNPVLSGSLASRTGPDARATNWSLTLAQELEIAGQSGLRVEAAEAELVSQAQQMRVVRASVAEATWLAWFSALAARERVQLARRIEAASLEVAQTAAGMVAHGLGSTVDAAVADAASVAASQRRIDAEAAASAAEIRLRQLVGVSADAPWSGALEPLRVEAPSAARRPELAALEALLQASARRVETLRRSRAPNPTLSVFAQNDGFDEKVFGVGVGLPIPLPQPLGRTRAGEIAEAVGAEERLHAELELLTRALNAERELAAQAHARGLAARALYSPERSARASEALAAIGAQVSAGRWSVREALASQRSLVEFLEAEVDAREALCAASVRLIRTHGGSLEGGGL
jgi:cobalt-zinc-cadmium efflux system outer membrane protein